MTHNQLGQITVTPALISYELESRCVLALVTQVVLDKSIIICRIRALLEITQTTDNGQSKLVIYERVFCPACKSGETNRISQQILKSSWLKIPNWKIHGQIENWWLKRWLKYQPVQREVLHWEVRNSQKKLLINHCKWISSKIGLKRT